MKITKYAHSCLLVEKGAARILIDPGMWNKTPDVEGLDAILITHEHQDHCDTGQLKELTAKNPNAKIITHKAVGEKLTEVGIAYQVIEPGEAVDINGVSVESYGAEHATIYGSISPCRNTGYMIGGELFAPGDALHDIPTKPVKILALPTGGPWMRLSEAIDYAKSIKPEIIFPIHDAMYIEEYRTGLVPRLVGGNLESVGIKFVDMAAGSSREF